MWNIVFVTLFFPLNYLFSRNFISKSWNGEFFWEMQMQRPRKRRTKAYQGCPKVWKSVGGGGSSNVVGIICSPVLTGLTDMPKSVGGGGHHPLPLLFLRPSIHTNGGCQDLHSHTHLLESATRVVIAFCVTSNILFLIKCGFMYVSVLTL